MICKFLNVAAGSHVVKFQCENNMSRNDYKNYNIEVGFVGSGGELSNKNIKLFTLLDLLDRNNIDQVDLLKMDIEGSEFSLFDDPSWLPRIKVICMEVHPEYGDPQKIIDVLTKFDFAFRIADENLNLLEDSRSANFIYAWKN